MITLENNELKISIALHGAELRSVIDKKDGREYMWSADPVHWGRVSPVLFPIVGRVFNNTYQFNGENYSLTQHGFLRDQTFELIDHSNHYVEFAFISRDDLLSVYPFRHEVRIAYELVGRELKIHWSVYNRDDKLMYYSIGAHPAFALNAVDSYRFDLHAVEEVSSLALVGGHISNKIPYTQTSIVVKGSAFEEDAIILTGLDAVDLVNETTGSKIRCSFPGFDYVGLWSNIVDGQMSPFVCIEPWLGITDEVGGYDDFSKKLSVKALDVNSNHDYVYSLEFV